MERRIGNRQIISIVVLFLIVQFGGLLLLMAALPISQLPSIQAATQASPPSASTIAFLIIWIIIVTIVLILLLKRFKGKFASFYDASIIVPGSTLTFNIILSIIFPQANASYVLALAIILGISVFVVKRKVAKSRNIVVILSIIGFGTSFGTVGFLYVYIICALIAAYDYIAVFLTKHMLTLANLAMKNNLALFISSTDVEVTPNRYLSKKERKEALKSGISRRIKDPYVKKIIKEGNTPTLSNIGLGGGDLILPLMLTSSTYVSFISYSIPFFLILGSTLGIIATLLILKRYKVPLPAIPPLFAFENLSLGAIVLIYGTGSRLMSLQFFAVFAFIMLVIFYTLRKNNPNQKA